VQAPGPADPAARAARSGEGSAIEVRSLTHRYPAPRRRRGEPAPEPRDALTRVSLDVGPGEVFGVLGPNGGGKSTLFRVLSTLLVPSGANDPDCGVRVLGRDLLREPELVRPEIGVVFQSPSVDGKLTAWENLECQARLYGLKGAGIDAFIGELLERFRLADRAHEAVERFSGGMRRRVELAKSLLHGPRLLLLDEPSTGLDPGARADLWAQLLALRRERGITIVLTTHLMEEAERCDRLAVLSEGKLAALDSPAALRSRIGGQVITLTAAAGQDLGSLREDVERRWGPFAPGALALAGSALRFEHATGAALVPEVASTLAGRYQAIGVGQPTLDDVFLHLTGHTLWEDQAGEGLPQPLAKKRG
jgi:ABC-2 type transport system ATP-binding protein